MKVEIINTGTEILLGEILNTNFQYLTQELNMRGFDVLYQTTVGDNPQRLLEAFEIASKRADIIIATGGLGPTKGDITKEILAEFTDLELVLDAETKSNIEAFFAKRSVCMPSNNDKQALIPEGATVLTNKAGTAPGLVVDQNDKIFVLLPGPPSELSHVATEQLYPYLEKRFPHLGTIKSHTLRLKGIGESALAEKIDDFITSQDNPTIAIYARKGEIIIRITAKAASVAEADALILPTAKRLEERLSNYIYGHNDESLAECVGRKLLKNKQTIAFAESCTGGLTSSLITDVPGSSSYLLGSVVTYSNEAKHNLINVSQENLDQFGAVSEQVACQMAEGVRKLFNTDYGVGVTGIAGPDGGTKDKPVGLVYIAVTDANGTVCQRNIFSGNRLNNKLRSALTALAMVYDRIAVEPMEEK